MNTPNKSGMKKFYVVEFNDGHTSPALDDIGQVCGYIQNHRWGTQLKKNPMIRVLGKQRSIYPTPGQTKREVEHQAYEGRRMAAEATM